jgi:very-short-patch-repair endonuclease
MLNVPIGRHGFEPDLVWPKYRLGLEYDGDYHRERRQFRDDIRRNEMIADDEWMTMRVTADDLYDRPRELAARIGRRLASRGWDGVVDLHHIGHFVR